MKNLLKVAGTALVIVGEAVSLQGSSRPYPKQELISKVSNLLITGNYNVSNIVDALLDNKLVIVSQLTESPIHFIAKGSGDGLNDAIGVLNDDLAQGCTAANGCVLTLDSGQLKYQRFQMEDDEVDGVQESWLQIFIPRTIDISDGTDVYVEEKTSSIHILLQMMRLMDIATMTRFANEVGVSSFSKVIRGNSIITDGSIGRIEATINNLPDESSAIKETKDDLVQLLDHLKQTAAVERWAVELGKRDGYDALTAKQREVLRIRGEGSREYGVSLGEPAEKSVPPTDSELEDYNKNELSSIHILLQMMQVMETRIATEFAVKTGISRGNFSAAMRGSPVISELYIGRIEAAINASERETRDKLTQLLDHLKQTVAVERWVVGLERREDTLGTLENGVLEIRRKGIAEYRYSRGEGTRRSVAPPTDSELEDYTQNGVSSIHILLQIIPLMGAENTNQFAQKVGINSSNFSVALRGHWVISENSIKAIKIAINNLPDETSDERKVKDDLMYLSDKLIKTANVEAGVIKIKRRRGSAFLEEKYQEVLRIIDAGIREHDSNKARGRLPL